MNSGCKRLAGLLACSALLWLARPASAQTITKHINVVPPTEPDNTGDTTTEGRLALGTAGGPDDAHVYYPCVVKAGGTYKMWYSGHDGVNVRIFMATSSNGLDWVKVNNSLLAASNTTGTDGRIPLGTSGGDITHALGPTVVVDGGVYKMWYAGYSSPNYRIFMATSTDGGYTWTKVNNAVLAPSDTQGTAGRIPLGNTGRGDVSYTYLPCVVKDGATFKMWYTGYDGTAYRVYMATSTDGGYTWNKVDNTTTGLAGHDSGESVSGGRVGLGSGGSGDDAHAYGMAIIHDDAVWRAWYGGHDGANVRTYHVTSTNGGYTWTKIDNTTTGLAGHDSGEGVSNGRIGLGSAGRGDVTHAFPGGLIKEAGGIKHWYFGNGGTPAANRVYHARLVEQDPLVANGAATNVTPSTADLVGELVYTGAPPWRVYCCWGLADGLYSTNAWAHVDDLGSPAAAGVLTNHLASVSNSTTYYCRYYAKGAAGEDWADEVTTFVTPGPPALNNGGGATAITASSATLRGQITGGTRPIRAYICWGDNNAGRTATSLWDTVVGLGEQTGAFSTGVTYDRANKTFYYVCYATNADGATWAAVTNFNSAGPGLVLSDAAAVVEGNAGSQTLTFTVSLLSTSVQAVTFSYGTSNGTATGVSDYAPVSSTLVMPAGLMSTSLTVSAYGDTEDEYGYEVFWVNITNAPNAIVVDGRGEGRIIDDDASPNVAVWNGTGNWNVRDYWTPGVPGVGDTVRIASGSCRLTNATPLLVSIEITNATLVCTGSNTAINATTVWVRNAGQLKHTTNSDKNHADGWQVDGWVHVVCSDLTLDAGAQINVNSNGWEGPRLDGRYGCGPGGGGSNPTDWGSGGSYGGVGGVGASGTYGPQPAYGSASRCTLPGSAGGNSGVTLAGQSSAGGGAVWIEAAGTVTLNGTITANGKDVPGDGHGSPIGRGRYGGGSGGGVCIDCATLAGIGRIYARGSGTGNGSGGGGGGRIAVHFGSYLPGTGIQMSVNKNGMGGTYGTVWVSDHSVLAQTWPDLDGNFVNAAPLSGYSWSFSAGSEVTFNASNVAFNLTGNLTVTNSTVTLYSGPTNATGPWTAYGATLGVSGTVSVLSSGILRLHSHANNGGAVRVTAGDVTVGGGGKLEADAGGFAGGLAAAHGKGPGRGYYGGSQDGTGAGYGGTGGGCQVPNSTTRGATYGSAAQPRQPGSGGGGSSGYAGGRGGGLIWLNVADTLMLNGSISVNGGNGTDGGTDPGGGSGGGVNITCGTFDGGAAGQITANGGTGWTRGGAGGGGRIAVHVLETLLWGYTNQCQVFNGTGYTPAAGLGTIFWEVIAAQLSVVDTSGYEGPSGTTTSLLFTVSIAEPSSSPVTVNYATSNGTALAGTDYLATNGTLTIPVGQVAVTAAVTVVGNDTEEYGYKTVYLVLSGATGASIQDAVGEGRILNDDDQPNHTVWAGFGDWDTPGNWTPGLPGALDTAHIRIGNCRISGEAVAGHVIVSNGASITFTSWNGVLSASEVTVRNGGTITHEANTDQNNLDGWTPDRRIHIVCSNLTVEAGGKLDAKAKGYHGSAGSWGCGPGGGNTAQYAGGGSYGGRGGYGVGNPPIPSGPTYGNALWPTNPGSAGGYSLSYAGGAILIEADGTVTVNGDVSADAEDVPTSDGTRHTRPGSSGGSVLIDCATLAGVGGAIHADGKGGWPFGGGGGGRVALKFDAHAPGTALALGANRGTYCTSGVHAPGTLWVSDLAVLAGVLVNRQGYFVNVTDCSRGGLILSNCLFTVWLSNTTFAVDGDLRLMSGTTLHVYSGPTNATGPWTRCGGAIEVTNSLVLGSSSVLYLRSQRESGGSLRIKAGDATVGTGCRIDADGLGYRGGVSGTEYGFGPGGSEPAYSASAAVLKSAAGGSYGGRGGYSATAGQDPGLPYGSLKLPQAAGSGAGGVTYVTTPSYGGDAGGLVWLNLTGRLTLNGTLTADGAASQNASSRDGGGGSGGGVYITCGYLDGSSNGWITATGGSGNELGGGGGGGRIAVHVGTKLLWDYTENCSVAGGPGYYAAGSANGAQEGTIYWGAPRAGSVFTVR